MNKLKIDKIIFKEDPPRVNKYFKNFINQNYSSIISLFNWINTRIFIYTFTDGFRFEFLDNKRKIKKINKMVLFNSSLKKFLEKQYKKKKLVLTGKSIIKSKISYLYPNILKNLNVSYPLIYLKNFKNLKKNIIIKFLLFKIYIKNNLKKKIFRFEIIFNFPFFCPDVNFRLFCIRIEYPIVKLFFNKVFIVKLKEFDLLKSNSIFLKYILDIPYFI